MKMNGATLAAVLREAAQHVHLGDSMEGSLAYTATMEPDVFEVAGCFRVGNLQGQGGVRLFEPEKGGPLDPEPGGRDESDERGCRIAEGQT